METFSESIIELMVKYFSSLNEKDKRRYAAIEAIKLGHGGITIISSILSIDPKTIVKGIKELKEKAIEKDKRIRKKGGGRSGKKKQYPNMNEVFLEIVDNHKAGNPMNSEVNWTYLTAEEIRKKLEEKNITVSIYIVKMLFRLNDLSKRKMSKKGTIKDVANRNEQFENIEHLKNEYSKKNNPIISMDTKKKEVLGTLYRDGKVYSEEPLKVFDHDYSDLQTGKIIPHGIYDIKLNKGFINLNHSSDTSELVYDSLLHWWNNFGKQDYPNADKLLLLCDGGGSNSCNHYVFKEAIQKLSNTIGINIRVAHYPAYCSKYNPIEHRFFCHVTRALSGVVLDSIDTIKHLIETRTTTKKNLRAYVNILDKVYETGKKASDDFMNNCRIVFDKIISKWNYCAEPCT